MSLQMFWCCSGIFQLLKPSQVILFATCLSSQNPLLKKGFIFLFHWPTQYLFPAFLYGFGLYLPYTGKGWGGRIGEGKLYLLGCKTDELANIFQGNFTRDFF